VIAVLVVLLAGLGFVGWKLFGGSAPAKPDQPGGTIAAQVPAKPDPATGTMTGDPQRTATPAKPSDAPIGNDPAKPVGTDPAKDPKTGTTVVAALPVDLPKPVDEPKPVPPKPVDEPKPEPKPVDQPKPEPPKAIDTSAFDKALAAREWANAKAEADALPDPARSDAKAKLTKAANSQLIATMRAAKPVYDQQRYAECAAMLGKEAATMDCADPDTRSKFIALVKAVRQAAKDAKDAQENP
jgi:outer membrane biosynthesis protein TonB